MREYEIRGYAVEEMVNSQWLYGYGVTKINYTDGTSSVHILTQSGDYRVEEKSVGQYTGLKDRNGVKIYEGDILVVSGYSYEEPEFECCGEVEYINCGFCIEDEGEFVNISELRGSYTTILHVVGNAYENPELLEEEHEN